MTFLRPDLAELELKWDFGLPSFHHVIEVSDDHLDVMGHTNNVRYLQWLEDVCWDHSRSIGLDWDRYVELNRTMVARRHEIDYLGATRPGETLLIGTWIVANDRKLTVERAYQIIRLQDRRTILRGRTRWVCVSVDTGMPKRMPEAFKDGYIPVQTLSGV